MKEISVADLKKMMDEQEEFQLIDVREPHEADICTLGGELIPLGSITSNADKIASDKKVVVYCRSGARSGRATNYLQSRLDNDRIFNLKGGIIAWANEIDPSMEKY